MTEHDDGPWSPGSDDDGTGDEELHLGRPARPRRWPWLIGAAAAAALAIRAVAATEPPAPHRTAVPSAAVQAGPSALPAPEPRTPMTTLDRVAALAAADSVRDYTRGTAAAGDCPVVAPGVRPAASVAEVAGRLLPGHLLDSAEVLDQFTGLCALEVRIRGYGGSVLVVSVAAPGSEASPGEHDRVTTGSRAVGSLITRYALNLTSDGWTVLVGVVGWLPLIPATTELSAAARQRALRW